MSLFESASLVVTPNGTKASKLYAIKPTSGAGDLTVVRATTATRVNSAGLIESVAVNVPRLDYTNSTCPSILVEPQRTNLSTYSDNFTDASWVKLGTSLTVTANTTISPDGTQNADTLNVSNNDNTLYKVISGTFVGNVYNFTIYAKGSGTFSMNIRLNSSTTTTETKTLSNQWQRFNVTVTNAVPITTIETYIVLNTSSTYNIWGAQLEAGAYATSYIPTTSASVTRNADVISKTGISSLIGTEFTLFLDAYETTGGNTTRYSALKGSGSTYENLLIIEANASNQIAVNLIGVFYGIIVPLVSGERFKLAVRCKNNDFAFYWNGNLVQSQSSGTVPVLSDLYLGYYTDYADNFNKINSSAIWKTGLTNAELAELTTI